MILILLLIGHQNHEKMDNSRKLKILFFVIFGMFPFLGKSQAHLGSTIAEIKAIHPDKIFTTKFTNNGIKYIYANMTFGTFYYYFDKESGLSNLCLQIPDNMNALNAQVEVYNKKYVIISETSWKAYLEGGGLMKINLKYDEDIKGYLFIYNYN